MIDRDSQRYAHSLQGRPRSEWETLAEHLEAVAVLAALHAQAFGMAGIGRTLGLLHDIGKVAQAYLTYISAPPEDGRKGPDHSTAGAREAQKLYGPTMGRMLAYAIAGHHAGLADPESLNRRLSPDDYEIRDYDGWRNHTGPLPSASDLAPSRQLVLSDESGFTPFFLTRMLFSALVDADFLATEAFYARANREDAGRGSHLPLDVLRDRLRSFMAQKQAVAVNTPVNALRRKILDHAVSKAELEPGLFTLTVPTGGGKTLASLSFALEHAARHGMRRVVYVIPYTSIIEQTAQVFRDALKTEDDVLEHHATFDWEGRAEEGDDEGRAGLSKLKKAAENWDVPVVVTTAVQFYESLFASRTSRCRKLHNLAGAVIVLDEAQTLPPHLLRPCLAALDELARNYGASVVVCTATQPAWRKLDQALPDGLGLDIGAERELAPDPDDLYQRLRRVTVEVQAETSDENIVGRFTVQPQMLCIVNTRSHARSLFEAIRHLPGAVHLSTLMCPLHRRQVLENVKARLRDGRPVRLVATSLIEAGVDVDFPEVWRVEAGLDSVAQAAGRCNREGRLETGRVVVFTPADAKTPQSRKIYQQALRHVSRAGHDDLLGLAANRDYFNEVYFQKGVDALDALEIDGAPGVMRSVRAGAGRLNFRFRSIAEAFRLIDDVMEPVVVPFDDRSKAILAELKAADRPLARHLRGLQPYIVAIPKKARDEWLSRGVLRPPHPEMGQGLLAFDDLAHYRETTGVNLADISQRDPMLNILDI
ncbi:CRISPR-associated endonuclease Cas3'' [Brevundimonas diminuta]|uniref:CRISPR-associated endonuclease Cas3'' n=1 Tax=Brevundimonas diminuta TaxID=293 RepID=UPI003D06F2CA